MFEKEKHNLYIGSDHAGFKMKDALKGYLDGSGYNVVDLGCFSEDPCDYPDIAREIGEKVHETEGSFGIAICGSGIGISIAVNKVRGIRGALCTSVAMAEAARKHNNANVICLAGRDADEELAKQMLDKFLLTDFEGTEERHVRRVQKLTDM